MSKKTVPFKMAASAPKPVDLNTWVQNRNGAEAVVEDAAGPAPVSEPAAAPVVVEATDALKRLTIDVPETLHRRVKAQCAGRGVKMADVIRDLLEREFPDGAGAR